MSRRIAGLRRLAKVLKQQELYFSRRACSPFAQLCCEVPTSETASMLAGYTKAISLTILVLPNETHLAKIRHERRQARVRAETCRPIDEERLPEQETAGHDAGVNR